MAGVNCQWCGRATSSKYKICMMCKRAKHTETLSVWKDYLSQLVDFQLTQRAEPKVPTSGIVLPGRKTFDFKEQLAISDVRESEFIELYKGPKLTKSIDRKWDFDRKDGLKIELKTDTYDMSKTQNFFMERFSDIKRQSPGGPWRALEDGVDHWIYWFPSGKVYFEFKDLEDLVKVLDEVTEKHYMLNVPNKGWTTGGYKVPRDLLSKLYRKVGHK